MDARTDDSTDLIERARQGDPLAEATLLSGHRDRLRRLVKSRLDRRLGARIDPSDVIQEALIDASKRLSAYLQNPPLPLLPWLSQFVRDRLAKLHRHHLRVGKRSIDSERSLTGQHPLADGTSPSGQLIRDEDCRRVGAAMARLNEGDRRLLAMRHIEALSMAQIATALGIKEGAAKVRHLRALRRLQTFLEERR